MGAAIYESIFNQGAATSTLNVNYQTGNCIFTPSDTLGFCSKCNDVAMEATSNCSTRQADPPSGGMNKKSSYYLPVGLLVDVRSENTPFTYAGSIVRSLDFVETTNMSVKAMNCYETLYSAELAQTPGSGVVTKGPSYLGHQSSRTYPRLS